MTRPAPGWHGLPPGQPRNRLLQAFVFSLMIYLGAASLQPLDYRKAAPILQLCSPLGSKAVKTATQLNTQYPFNPEEEIRMSLPQYATATSINGSNRDTSYTRF
jgi:hypothetical protein